MHDNADAMTKIWYERSLAMTRRIESMAVFRETSPSFAQGRRVGQRKVVDSHADGGNTAN